MEEGSKVIPDQHVISFNLLLYSKLLGPIRRMVNYDLLKVKAMGVNNS